MKDYLTPKEFAQAARVSKQTIYRQLDGRLAPFVLTLKGQRMISADALSEFYEVDAEVNQNQPNVHESKPQSTKSKPKSTENSQLESTDSKPESTENSQPYVHGSHAESTEKQIEKRVEELEKLIQKHLETTREEQAFLKDQIKIKDEQIKDLSKRLEAAHENLRVAQQLAAIDKQRTIALEERQHKKTDVVEQEAVVAEPDATDRHPEPQTVTTASQEPPTNFWGRLRWLFGFKN